MIRENAPFELSAAQGNRPNWTLHQTRPPDVPIYPAAVTNMRVSRRDRLGGLIHEYAQIAHRVAVFDAHTVIFLRKSA